MDNPQIPLICDTLGTSLSAVIVALGGNKRAGSLLWPSLPADDAGRKLAHCMNPDKREKLSPDELVRLLKAARQVGCHTAMAYLARELGYADPQPVEPEDERAALQREYIAAVKTLAAITTRIERNGLRAA